jgi:hypothetical protein
VIIVSGQIAETLATDGDMIAGPRKHPQVIAPWGFSAGL